MKGDYTGITSKDPHLFSENPDNNEDLFTMTLDVSKNMNLRFPFIREWIQYKCKREKSPNSIRDLLKSVMSYDQKLERRIQESGGRSIGPHRIPTIQWDYLLVIDFEATCDNSEKATGP